MVSAVLLLDLVLAAYAKLVDFSIKAKDIESIRVVAANDRSESNDIPLSNEQISRLKDILDKTTSRKLKYFSADGDQFENDSRFDIIINFRNGNVQTIKTGEMSNYLIKYKGNFIGKWYATAINEEISDFIATLY